MRQLKKNERGLCNVAKCDNALTPGGKCKKHKDAAADAARERYRKARPEGVLVRLCSKCGKAGHNASRCVWRTN